MTQDRISVGLEVMNRKLKAIAGICGAIADSTISYQRNAIALHPVKGSVDCADLD